MASQSIDELFDKYPEQVFELLFITDIFLKKEPFYYKVIFKFESNDKIYCPVAEVAPENLHSKYKVGALFHNHKQIGYSPDVDILTFQINNTTIQPTYVLEDVIDSYDNFIIDKSNILIPYIIKQKCYMIKYNDYDIVIPHYAIANHFHFKSASLKNAFLNNTIDYLFHRNSFIRVDKDNVNIHIKKKANKQDIKDICTFLEDKYCLSTFQSYVIQRKYKDLLIPIESKFPYLETFDIKASVKNISNNSRAKYLILGIYQNNYHYKFKTINYKTDESTAINTQNINEGVFIKEIPTKRTNKHKNTTPSSKYVNHHTAYIDKNFQDEEEIILNKTVNGISSNNPLLTNESEITVSNSSEQSTNDGNEEVQQEVSSSRNENTRDKEIFNIYDLNKLLENIKSDKNVEDLQFNIMDKFILPEENNKIPSKYYIQDNIIRHYLSGNFKLKNTNIPIDKDFINNIMKMYLIDKIILKNIDKLLLEDEITFVRIVHPINMSKETISNWCERLLSQLEKRI